MPEKSNPFNRPKTENLKSNQIAATTFVILAIILSIVVIAGYEYDQYKFDKNLQYKGDLSLTCFEEFNTDSSKLKCLSIANNYHNNITIIR